MQKEFYTVTELMKLLNMSRQTLLTAIKYGRIQAFRVGVGIKSPYRIHHTEIERIQQMGFQDTIRNLKDLIKEIK